MNRKFHCGYIDPYKGCNKDCYMCQMADAIEALQKELSELKPVPKKMITKYTIVTREVNRKFITMVYNSYADAERACSGNEISYVVSFEVEE